MVTIETKARYMIIHRFTDDDGGTYTRVRFQDTPEESRNDYEAMVGKATYECIDLYKHPF